jgi:hypothetical protein
MSRRTKNPFANCETVEQFANALQERIASGNLTIAEQKAAALLAQIRGWTSQPLPNVDDSQSQIVSSGTNLSEIRRQLAEGLSPNDTALDWILNSPDEIFRERVERITKTPIASDENHGDFAIRLCNQALALVQSVRRTLGTQAVTMDECISTLAGGSEAYLLWTGRAAHREALKIILEVQSPDGGFGVPWIVPKNR